MKIKNNQKKQKALFSKDDLMIDLLKFNFIQKINL